MNTFLTVENQEKNSFGRISACVFFTFLFGGFLLFLSQKLGPYLFRAIGDDLDSERWKSLGLDTLPAFTAIFISFVTSVKLFHKKNFTKLIRRSKEIQWNKSLFALFLWIGLQIGTDIIGFLINPSSYTISFEWTTFVPAFAIGFFLIPIQTSFEELFFRGYIMQSIGLVGNRSLISLVFSSLSFGLLHFLNPEVQHYGIWITMLNYIMTGFFLGILTLMDDGLELALGVHAANNLYSFVVSFPVSVIPTPSILRISDFNIYLMTLLGIIVSVIFVVIAAKKYRWENWEKLWITHEVENQDKIIEPLSSETIPQPSKS